MFCHLFSCHIFNAHYICSILQSHVDSSSADVLEKMAIVRSNSALDVNYSFSTKFPSHFRKTLDYTFDIWTALWTWLNWTRVLWIDLVPWSICIFQYGSDTDGLAKAGAGGATSSSIYPHKSLVCLLLYRGTFCAFVIWCILQRVPFSIIQHI